MITQKAKVLPLAAAVVVVLASGAPAFAEEKCGLCHPETRVAHESSVHAREEVGCVACHGGDATVRETKLAHSDNSAGNFRSLADRRDVPAACATCHADLETMRPYNLPIDQLALYQTSAHGVALARGETRAAVCTDCHASSGGPGSVHDIRSPRDPESTVYDRNLPLTCGRCHGDAELMSAVGLDAKVVDDYLSCVHGVQLLENGNLAAPNCTSCHGVHGANPPGHGDIDKVCGSCHGETRRAYVEGPHHEAMSAAGLPECVACHSQHAIVRHRPDEIGELCLECHEKDSRQVRLGLNIRALIDEAEEQLRGAQEIIERAEQVPLHVEDHRARLEEGRTYLTEALPLTHGVEEGPVEELTRRAASIGEEIQHDLHPQFNHRVYYLGLVVFWFYLVVTLAILVARKRRLRQQEKRHQEKVGGP